MWIFYYDPVAISFSSFQSNPTESNAKPNRHSKIKKNTCVEHCARCVDVKMAQIEGTVSNNRIYYEWRCCRFAYFYLLFSFSLPLSLPFHNKNEIKWRTHKLFSQFMFYVYYTHIESHTRYKFAKCECAKWYFYVFDFNGRLKKKNTKKLIWKSPTKFVCLIVYSWTWIWNCIRTGAGFVFIDFPHSKQQAI